MEPDAEIHSWRLDCGFAEKTLFGYMYHLGAI